MGMVVRTNTMSTNAYRQLGMNNTSVSKSLEKLSSGFRINRAGDDASGLAISEKMKAQINGLEQASSNSQDGISLIQTAEGATTEIHNMLNRMVTLATKSANGTIQNEVDRDAIQTEVDALNTEITRIAKATNFNGINLLDGSLSGNSGSVAVTNMTATMGKALGSTGTGLVKGTPAALANSVVTDWKGVTSSTPGTVAFEVGSYDSDGKWTADAAGATATGDTLRATVTDSKTGEVSTIEAKWSDVYSNTTGKDPATGATITSSADMAAGHTATINLASFGLGKIDMVATGAETAASIKGALNGASVATYDGKAQYTIDLSAQTAAGAIDGQAIGFTAVAGDGADAFVTAYNADDSKGYVASYDTGTKTIALTAKKAGIVTTDPTSTATGATTVVEAVKGADVKSGSGAGGLTLQVGDTNDTFNKVTVSVDDLTAEGLGTAGLDVSSQTAAGDAIQTIKDAINQVSTNRGNLGALQNRLEYTINNLDTTNENMTSANSRIRDTDMAKEMMNYTKMNILTQAAQSMLAQANQQPQQILQLLQ